MGRNTASGKTPKTNNTQLSKQLPALFRTQTERTTRHSSNRTQESDSEIETETHVSPSSSPTRHPNVVSPDLLYAVAADIKSSVKAAITELRDEMRAMSGRIDTIEKRESTFNTRVHQLEEKEKIHTRQMMELSRHLEDLDNRGRRNNIRLRGIPEDIDYTHLEPTVSTDPTRSIDSRREEQREQREHPERGSSEQQARSSEQQAESNARRPEE